MSAHLYIEGSNADSKEAQIRCREGFRKLIEKMGHAGRMPGLSACGPRDNAFKDFQTALRKSKGNYIALLIDSEDPIAEVERVWSHLEQRDGWKRPEGVQDDQALLMATCMETWIVADREVLKEHYRKGLQENALPALVNLEQRQRDDVQDRLSHATRNCPNKYAKGDRSFELLAKLRPAVLKEHLPSFVRIDRILKDKLGDRDAPRTKPDQGKMKSRKG